MPSILDEIIQKSNDAIQRLAQVNQQLANVVSGSVRFNPAVGSGGGYTATVPGVGNRIIPTELGKEALAAQSSAATQFANTLKFVNTIITELGSQAKVSGKDLKIIRGTFEEFEAISFTGVSKNWEADLSRLVTKLNEAVAAIAELKAARDSLRATKTTTTPGGVQVSSAVGEVIPATPTAIGNLGGVQTVSATTQALKEELVIEEQILNAQLEGLPIEAERRTRVEAIKVIEKETNLELQAGIRLRERLTGLAQNTARLQGRTGNYPVGGQAPQILDPTGYRQQMQLAETIGTPQADQAFNQAMRARIQMFEQMTPLQRMLYDAEQKRSQGLIQETSAIEKATRATKDMTQAQVQQARGQQYYKQAFAMIDKRAAELGVDPETVRIQAMRNAASGYTQFTANFGEVNGVMEKATITIDKLGNAAADTQRRFRTFFDSIRRDMVEFLKWTIAAAAIWGTFQKISEGVSQMIKNQSELANITIALGQAQSDLNQIYEDAIDIANTTGTAIQGVLEGYTLAYRATGNIADASERTAKANKLMADSLTLASLSGMDQATALDTLVAAEKQTNTAIEDGSILLDKWVKTTRLANVDLETLSTGFAVLGDTAIGTGMSIEELDGFLATIAETGVATGKEVANAAKAIIGGFQSESAQKAIQNLGISMTKSGGEAKTFLELLQEISDLSKSGVISPEALQPVTLAVGGGGSRRQAVVSTLIQNMGRVSEVATGQLNTNGEAAAALQIKLDTVEKALVKLGNAFQSLTQSIGSEGGALSVIKLLVDALTGLVNIADKFAKLAGTTLIPTMITLIALWASAGKNNFLTQFGTRAMSPFERMFGGGRIPEMQNPNQYDLLRTQVGIGQGRGTNIGGNIAGALGGTLISAIVPTILESLSTGKVDWGKTGTRIGTSIVGGLIGALAGGPAGALIGSSLGGTIGEALISFIENNKPRFKDAWSGVILPPGTPGTKPTTPAEREAAEIELARQLKELTRPGSNLQNLRNLQGERIGIGEYQRQLQRPMTAEEALQKITPVYGEEWVKGEQAKLAQGGKLPEKYFDMARAIRASEEFNIEFPDTIKNIIDGLKPAEQAVEEIKLTTPQSEFQKGYVDIIEQTMKKMDDEITRKLVSGELTKAAAGASSEALSAFPSRVAIWGEQIRNAFSDMTDEQFTKMIADITAYSPQDVTQTISDLIGEGQLELAKKLIESTYQQNLTNIPAMQQLDLRKQNIPDMGKFLDQMLANYEERLNTIAGYKADDRYTPEWVNAMMESLAPFAIMTDQGLIIRELPSGISADWAEILDETKKQTGIMESNIGYQLGGMTQGEYAAIQPQYEAIRAAIIAAGGTSEETPQVVMFDDGQFSLQQKDWKIIQYLLGQIQENTKKQLEGMYNLPEGASFWFPSSAIPYMQAAANGGGGSLTPENLPAVIASGIKMAGDTGPGLGRSWVDNKPQEILNPTIEGMLRKYGPFQDEPPLGEIPAGSWLDQLLKPIGPPTPGATGTTNPLNPTGGQTTAPIPVLVTNPINLATPTGGGSGLIRPQAYSTKDTSSLTSDIQDLLRNRNQMSKLPTLNTKIELMSTVQLIADGRTLASVVAPWLGEFIQNFNGSSTSSTIKAVI